METIKSVIGLGSGNSNANHQEKDKPEEAGEPGAGTADQGNEAAADTVAEKDKAEADTTAGATADADADADAAATSGPPTAESDTPEGQQNSTEAPKRKDKPKVGSPAWFATALPGRKKKTDQSQEQADGIAAPSASDKASNEKPAASSEKQPAEEVSLPPNHIGPDPPPGLSDDLAVYSPPTPDEDGKKMDEQPSSSEVPGSKSAAPPVEVTDHSDSPLKPADAAKESQYREASIPTAGGIRLGSVATEERRKSADVRRKSQSVASSDLPDSERPTVPPVKEEESTPAEDPAAAEETAPPPPAKDDPAASSSAAPEEVQTVSAPEPEMTTDTATGEPLEVGDPKSHVPDTTEPVQATPEQSAIPTAVTKPAKKEEEPKKEGGEKRHNLFKKIKSKLKQ